MSPAQNSLWLASQHLRLIISPGIETISLSDTHAINCYWLQRTFNLYSFNCISGFSTFQDAGPHPPFLFDSPTPWIIDWNSMAIYFSARPTGLHQDVNCWLLIPGLCSIQIKLRLWLSISFDRFRVFFITQSDMVSQKKSARASQTTSADHELRFLELYYFSLGDVFTFLDQRAVFSGNSYN